MSTEEPLPKAASIRKTISQLTPEEKEKLAIKFAIWKRKTELLKAWREKSKPEPFSTPSLIFAADVESPRVPRDSNDVSTHPSYTSFLKCCVSPIPKINHYREAKKKYQKQFLHEIEQHELQQDRVFEAMLFHRCMAYTTLWPPLHSRRELELIHHFLPQITYRQRQRIIYLRRHTIT